MDREQYEAEISNELMANYDDSVDIAEVLTSCMRWYDRSIANDLYLMPPKSMIAFVIGVIESPEFRSIYPYMKSINLDYETLMDKVMPVLKDGYANGLDDEANVKNTTETLVYEYLNGNIE